METIPNDLRFIFGEGTLFIFVTSQLLCAVFKDATSLAQAGQRLVRILSIIEDFFGFKGYKD